MKSEKTDEQIMSLVVESPDMYGEIIDRYTDKLSRYIRRITSVTEDELQDILQDVFVKAYEKSASFNVEMSFNSWIYRICHNTSINYWKKNKRYQEGQSFDDDTQGFLDHLLRDDSVLDQIMIDADKVSVRSALALVKEKYRQILVLRFFEEKDYTEISDILKIPPGTVATNIHRAKKSLAKELSLLEKQKP